MRNLVFTPTLLATTFDIARRLGRIDRLSLPDPNFEGAAKASLALEEGAYDHQVKYVVQAYEKIGTHGDLAKAHALVMKNVPNAPSTLKRTPDLDFDPTHPVLDAIRAHQQILNTTPFSRGSGLVARLWQRDVLHAFDPVLATLPIEPVLARRADDYLRLSVRPQFVEFVLVAMRDAMDEWISANKPGHAMPLDRLESARAALGKREFSRKDYLAIVKATGITGSRDLARGVEERILTVRGTTALARYRFRP